MTYEDYVTLEQAQRLKKFGFNWPCRSCWENESDNGWVLKGNILYGLTCSNEFDDELARPTLAQAAKWLRNIKKYDITITPSINTEGFYYVDVFFYWADCCNRSVKPMVKGYEKALSYGIDTILERIERE